MLINIKNGKFNTEKIVTFKCTNPKIEGIVVIHNTRRGPAMGGCRIYGELDFKDGIKDAVQLAKAMTYKNALVGLPYGGGKAVIIKHNSSINEAMECFGKVMNLLNGDYLTTDDVGTNCEDMDFLKKYTRYVVPINGSPMPSTAYGVYQAIKSAIYSVEDQKSIKNLKIAVQGLGKVGLNLCKFLYDEGCKLYVCDVKQELEKLACERFNAITFKMDTLSNLDLDVFSPCALGNVITRSNYSEFKARYIIGGANNPLSHDVLSDFLHKKGVTYIPDFLSNAGGVIEVDCENHDFEYNDTNVLKRVKDVIYNTTMELLQESLSFGLSPLKIAQNRVEKILKS